VVERPREVSFADEAAPTDAGPPALVRGMFVTVRIHAEPRATLLRVPERAVRPGGRVWTIRRREGRTELEQLSVRVLRVADATAIVTPTEGGDDGRMLEAGDRIVVTPPSNARKGMVVREQ
jgi:multidrug efflux pump subunit AcrA (membrane-fusion protein)